MERGGRNRGAVANWWRTADPLIQGSGVSANCSTTGARLLQPQISGKSFDPKPEVQVLPPVLRSLRASATLEKQFRNAGHSCTRCYVHDDVINTQSDYRDML